MSYIFLDESGDLGFDFSKVKTSRYFVIAFLFVENRRPIEKIVKKIYRGFSKKEIKFHKGVLHCYKEKSITGIRLLKLLNEKDISILSIYLNKKKVYYFPKKQNLVRYIEEPFGAPRTRIYLFTQLYI